jgi:hypothetical protein
MQLVWRTLAFLLVVLLIALIGGVVEAVVH